MKKVFLLSSISMSILTACGGGSTSELNETTPQDGSVVLSAGETVSVSSAEAVRAFDFENSPVGSTVNITGGNLAGVELTVAEPVAGKPSLIIKAPMTDIEIISAAVGEVETWINAGITLTGVDGDDSGRMETVNGKQLWFGSQEKGLGTTFNMEGYISIDTGSSTSLEAYLSAAQVGNDTSLIVGGSRYDETALKMLEYSPPASGGIFEYTGAVVMFAEDDSSYSSEMGRIQIDFDNNTGTFSANNFTPDEGAPAKNISLSSILEIDNGSGSISALSGTITSGNETNNLALNGVIAFDSSAVAGGLVPQYPTDGIVAGVYLLPQDP